MYTEFFGLSAKPFELVPNPRFLYPSQVHQKVLNHLQYGLAEGVGFILFTGEVGSGKTTILRDLIRTVKSTAPVSVIFNTRIDGLQLLAMINEDFGLETVGKDKQGLLRDLNDFLIESLGLGMRPIIIIDEAQNLTAEALEEVRLLSNLESDSAKLVQVVLVGQPELREMIAAPALLQLRQRIVVKCHLNPLGREELEKYILHRLEVAGHDGSIRFEPEVFDSIYQFSNGVPRLINLLCDYLLLAAFTEESRLLTAVMCREVAHELAWDLPGESPTADAGSEDKPAADRSNKLVKELFGRFDAIQGQLNEISAALLNLNHTTENIDVIVKHVLEHENMLNQIGKIEFIRNKIETRFNRETRPSEVVDLVKGRKPNG